MDGITFQKSCSFRVSVHNARYPVASADIQYICGQLCVCLFSQIFFPQKKGVRMARTDTGSLNRQRTGTEMPVADRYNVAVKAVRRIRGRHNRS